MLTIADHLMTQNERRTKRRTTPQRQGPRPLHTRHARCGTVTSKQTRTRESPCEYSGRGVVVEQLQRFGIAAMRSRWTGGNQWIGTSIVWLEGASIRRPPSSPGHPDIVCRPFGLAWLSMVRVIPASGSIGSDGSTGNPRIT